MIFLVININIIEFYKNKNKGLADRILGLVSMNEGCMRDDGL